MFLPQCESKPPQSLHLCDHSGSQLSSQLRFNSTVKKTYRLSNAQKIPVVSSVLLSIADKRASLCPTVSAVTLITHGCALVLLSLILLFYVVSNLYCVITDCADLSTKVQALKSLSNFISFLRWAYPFCFLAINPINWWAEVILIFYKLAKHILLSVFFSCLCWFLGFSLVHFHLGVT